MIAPIAAAAAGAGSFLAANAGAVAAASAATTIAGTGLSFYGQRQQAKAAESAAAYNARQARQQAGYESDVAAENARRQQDYSRQVIGAQRAAMATSGLAPAGTPLVRLGDTASSLQQEILDIGQAAALRSRSLIAGADMTLWEGAQSASALRTSSWATLGSGLANATTGFLTASGNIPTRTPSQY